MSVGPDEIARWFASHPVSMTARTSTGRAAASGDLGYTCGRHDMTEPPAEDGAYLRVWSRQPDGQWRVAADVTALAGP